MSTAALPSLFISHGSPMTALDGGAAGAFWARLGPAIDASFGRPRAILALSAHTLAPMAQGPVLLAGARHDTVHDFGGFPQPLYQLRYDAPGAPALADEVATLMAGAGEPVQRLDRGGLDHGIWVPLRSMYPLADVPVLPLAWPANWAPARLQALGHALAPLAAQGVLIVGTGAITHNLRLWAGGRGDIHEPEWPASAAFRLWMTERLAAADWAALQDWQTRAPEAALMHPSTEHLLPLWAAAGAGQDTPGLRLHASVTWGHLGMDSFAFGGRAPELAAELAESIPAMA